MKNKIKITPEVDTKIVTKKGEDLSVDYKLIARNGGWKVFDVIIDEYQPSQ